MTHSLSNSPRVSVVISTYNSADLLKICLGRLECQTVLEQCEVIVIDSGSEHNEYEVCQQASKSFPRLVYERTDKETLYSAWNRALSKARGDYFVNVNTDDALAPDALESFLQALDNDHDAVLAYADCVWSPVPNGSYPWPDTWYRVRYEPYRADAALFYCFTACIQFWRISALKNLGGFEPGLRAVGDYEALCRMVNNGMKAVHIPRPLSAFYQNPQGLSQISTAANEEFLKVRERFRKEIDLSKIFQIDTSKCRARRGAYLSLAVRALDVRIPWIPTPAPDVDYAIHNLQAAADQSCTFRSMLLKWTASLLARGSQGNPVCKSIAQLLLSQLGVILLHGRRFPRVL